MYTQILHRICYVHADVTTWIEHIAWMLTCMYMWIEAIMVDMHTRELCYLVACTSTAMYTLTLLTRCFDADMYVHVVRGYGTRVDFAILLLVRQSLSHVYTHVFLTCTQKY